MSAKKVSGRDCYRCGAVNIPLEHETVGLQLLDIDSMTVKAVLVVDIYVCSDCGTMHTEVTDTLPEGEE